MKKFRLVLAIAFVLSVIIAPRVAAEGTPMWTDNGVVISDTTNAQYEPQLVGDGSGGAIIVWTDQRDGDDDIYAQRVDAGGNAMWNTNGLAICDTVNSQDEPQLVSNGSGGAFIAWQDNRGSDHDIYAQHVDAGGNILWGSNGKAVCNAASDQGGPQLVGDGLGGVIIAWHDYRNGNYDIYAQRFDNSGNRKWISNGVAICDTTDNQYSPQIVGDGSGGSIITWVDYRSGISDIYIQRIDDSGSPLWTSNGVVVCDTIAAQGNPQLLGDGAGGAIITWQDYRDGNPDIYAQRVDAAGNSLWISNGVVVCDTSGNQEHPQLVGVGAGGVIIVWDDRRSGEDDIYAQSLDADGNRLWATNGVAVCNISAGQIYPQLVGDGSGGAIITWMDHRSGADDIYAQGMDADGNRLWAANGVVICDATSNQSLPQLMGDGSGGAVITWYDNRNGNYDIYAQQVLDPEPRIAAIIDVPEDQGRQVSVLWDRSGADHEYYQMITEYSIWRKTPVGSKIVMIGREWDGTLPKGLSGRIYRCIPDDDVKGESQKGYWELVGTQEAHYFEGYSFTAPTQYDSSASNLAYFSFIVSAHTSDPYVFYDSAPDSGYSVDDINPAKTQIGIIASGSAKGAVNTVWLSWNQVTLGVDGSSEQGPVDYRVYCDESSDFTPVPGNLLVTTSQLNYPHTDARIGDAAANLFYLVTAVDGSGNESAVSNIVGEFDKSLSDAK